MTWQELWDKVVAWMTSDAIINTVVKVIISIILLFISFKIINGIAKRILKRGEKRKTDKTILKTLVYIAKIILKILVAICIVGYLGIDTSGVTALITSLGVCAGLAVNGALSNFAGGILIILTRPFKVDDYIEAQGQAGTVAEIRITNTKLITPDNKVIYIPNGTLANGEIVNYSENPIRRLDMQFSVAYESDIEQAKQIIRNTCEKHELILKDKEIFVRVGEYADSSIEIKTRVWVNKEDYWTVNFDLLEQVKNEFDKNQIEIPYNQLCVNIKKD